NVGDNLGFFSPRPLTTYDDLSPEGGTYISDDYRTILVVQDCAFVPSDSKEEYPDFEANTLRFPFDEESRDGTSALASVALTAVAGGKAAVLDGDVHGWGKQPDGAWERGTRSRHGEEEAPGNGRCPCRRSRGRSLVQFCFGRDGYGSRPYSRSLSGNRMECSRVRYHRYRSRIR